MGSGRYDALLIDFYGTIADGDRLAVENTCARVVADYRLPMTAAELAITWGKRFFAEIEVANHDRFLNLYECECKTLIETLRPLTGAIDPRPYCDMLKEYWANPLLHLESIEAMAGVRVPVCCVSNADTEDILQAVERHGLRFDRIITSEDARCYKPDRAIFEEALAAMNVRPDRVLHVGDSLHSDVGGASRLGITTAWICRDGRIFDTGNSIPDHKILSLMDLHDILT